MAAYRSEKDAMDAFALIAAAPARDLAAVIKGAADKLDAAVCCHPNAVDTLIHEALEILDGDREPDATPASRGQAPATQQAGVALSDDLRDRLVAISEAVADQDDRAAQAMLREILKAPQPSPTAQADSVREEAARYRWLRDGNDAKHGAAWHVAVNLYGCEWDAAIDAARKRGEKQ